MRILLFILFILKASSGFSQQPDSVKLLIDSALRVMEHRAYYAERLDWPAIRAEVLRRSEGAKTPAEAGPALFWAFDLLHDKHGWLTIADSTHHNPYMRRDSRSPTEGMLAAFRKGPRLYNGIVAGKYAYISIHFFMGQTVESMTTYAQQIQDSLMKNVNSKTAGIIIDLRLNGGGNVYPMMLGVANVLGNRDFSESVDHLGRSQGKFGIRNNTIVLQGNHNDSFVLQLQRIGRNLSKMPVAVLIGPSTGSAAEQLAIAFTSRPNSVLIGERSAGYVTGNNGFELPGTGNGIVVAESLTRNMKGMLFEDAVEPQVTVTGGDDLADRGRDEKIRAALRWLKNR